METKYEKLFSIYSLQSASTTHYNLSNKDKVKLKPLEQCQQKLKMSKLSSCQHIDIKLYRCFCSRNPCFLSVFFFLVVSGCDKSQDQLNPLRFLVSWAFLSAVFSSTSVLWSQAGVSKWPLKQREWVFLQILEAVITHVNDMKTQREKENSLLTGGTSEVFKCSD